MRGSWLIFLLGVLVLTGLGLIVSQFSHTARIRRRLRKSHSRLESKARKPMVRFSVRPPKE